MKIAWPWPSVVLDGGEVGGVVDPEMVEWPPEAARVITLPGTPLPLWSPRVTVIVETEVPSAGTANGLAATDDWLACGSPRSIGLGPGTVGPRWQ